MIDIDIYSTCPHCDNHGVIHSGRSGHISGRSGHIYTHNKWWHTTPAGHLTYCPRP